MAHLTGCVPFPNYRTVQPPAQLTVSDEKNAPVEGAAVTLTTNINLGAKETRETKTTDARGLAVFEKRSEWQTETLMLHGSNVYFWGWCVQKPGFKTYHTGAGPHADFQEQATVQLARGTSTQCPAH